MDYNAGWDFDMVAHRGDTVQTKGEWRKCWDIWTEDTGRE
jgi:hypothetical protein